MTDPLFQIMMQFLAQKTYSKKISLDLLWMSKIACNYIQFRKNSSNITNCCKES